MSLLVRTCSTERMNTARIAARGFLLIGALLWVIMLVAQGTVQSYSSLAYTFDEVVQAGLSALIPAAIAIGVFVLALFYERLAAVVLFAAAGVVAVWGIVAGWEAGSWVSMLLVMVMPLIVSGVLLLLAASTQKVCELEGKI